MKLTLGEMREFQRKSLEQKGQPTKLEKREKYLRSLGGKYNLDEMNQMLRDNLTDYIERGSLCNFCTTRGIQFKRLPNPLSTKRGKALDINDDTSNGVNKAEYTTLNRNDYERYT